MSNRQATFYFMALAHIYIAQLAPRWLRVAAVVAFIGLGVISFFASEDDHEH